MAKEIAVFDGLVTTVDDEDYPLLSRFCWHTIQGKNTLYAARNWQVGNGAANRRRISLLMHRLIIPCEPGMMIDHKDGNGLNNQKANLRCVTNSQNQMNRAAGLRNMSSCYKGVSYNRRLAKWHAYIKVKQKRRHLGFFESEVEAAKAYDTEALRAFGQYARPNFPNPEPSVN